MALILAECRRLNADSSFLPRGHQRVVHREADREAQEPGVVIEHPQRGIDETDEGHRAARPQRANRVPVDPAGEFVEASAAVEVFHQDDFFAQHEVVADQHAGDGAEKAQVAHQPAKNVAAIVGKQLPRLHQNAYRAGHQTPHAEADAPRVEIGKIVCGRDNVRGTLTLSVAINSAIIATTTASGFPSRLSTATGSQMASPKTTMVAEVTAMPINE